jgi:hypothetical protein
MIIIICMATLITVLYGPTFGSLPQSARYPDLRPLANPFAAARALSLSLSRHEVAFPQRLFPRSLSIKRPDAAARVWSPTRSSLQSP